MKIATFNINNVNKRLENLLSWLAKGQPDVVSLQELKAEHGAFPAKAFQALGYEAVWQGERSWNGVAILARKHLPVLTRTSLPGNPEDRQARYIEAVIQGVLVTSIHIVTFAWSFLPYPQTAAERPQGARHCWPIQPDGCAPFPRGSKRICAHELRHME